MKIGAKIYYDKETGQVIWIIGERSGDVIETTRDQDFKAYTALSERVSETVGLLQLEYGDYEADYDEGGVIIRIDLETMEPLFTYPDPEPVDPETPQEPRPALSKQVEVLIQDNTLLKAQSKALAERASFTDDVIAEIAIEVYK
ncbi:hypothetical protein [Paenibacillus illinoisensis]|uniref:hypothetical protein n=1 Tax=Paenibacillus illinoisensis TaxID=59845 RepID=UPI00203EC71D|nr:hypothetical protein [Paenibacillus illinoisensis]MCM3206376.1 hypothetical protein [Paenibacillus illinoisensis]